MAIKTSLPRGEEGVTVVFFTFDAATTWPPALLNSFPGAQVVNAGVASLELRSTKQRGQAAAEQCVQLLWRQQQQQQHVQQQGLVLVAQGFGGHLLKEAVLQIARGAASLALPALRRQQYACALASIKGLAFLCTPHEPLPQLALPEYEYVLPDMAPACKAFRALCVAQGWQTLGVGAAVQGAPSQSVPLKTAAKGMSHFVAVPASQSDVVAPNSSSHPTCLALQQFVKRLSQDLAPAADAVAVLASRAAHKVAAADIEGAPAPIRTSLLRRLVMW